MNSRLAMLIAGAGAGLMYLMDPQAGNRRRAILRDKARRAVSDAGDAMRPAVRDLYNRAYGTVVEARSRFTEGSDDPGDSLLADRVRSELGRVVGHPRAVGVDVVAGRVILDGDVLASEERRLLRTVGAVRGVQEVESRLRVHPEAVPLAGGTQSGAQQRTRGNWPPGIRLAASTLGGALLLAAGRRRGLLRFLLGSAGTSLLARGTTNMRLRQLAGAGTAEPAIDVHKTLTVDAPVERVFALWTDVANFPHFMRNVREVRDLGGGRSQWTVAGPAGIPVTWTAAITDYVPNEVLAWQTERGAAVHHAGAVRFERLENGKTRADVRLSYRPIGGPVGHRVASLFGADPKSEMDADLARMKTLLETGKPPHDAAQPSEAPLRARPETGNGGRPHGAGAQREEKAMQIKDVMTTDVEVVRPDALLREAAKKMKDRDVGPLPVCDGEKLVGMLTDRDIVVRAVAEDRDPSTTTVEQAMTADVSYCYEDQDTEEAARLMEELQIRRLPIVNREKRLVGIVALGDLAVKDDEQLAGEALSEISQPAEPRPRS